MLIENHKRKNLNFRAHPLKGILKEVADELGTHPNYVRSKFNRGDSAITSKVNALIEKRLEPLEKFDSLADRLLKEKEK